MQLLDANTGKRSLAREGVETTEIVSPPFAGGAIGPTNLPSSPKAGRSAGPLPGGSTLYEVRFHGRGGQGTVVASVLLAKAAFIEGRGVQAFPFFGVERRGAPVVAYTRVGLEPVRLACAVANPNALIVMDPSLLAALGGDWMRGLKPGGHVLINANHVPRGIIGGPGAPHVAHLDAATIAHRHGLGSAANPLVNTVILGAFAKFTGIVTMPSLREAIQAKVPVQVEENIEAANEAYELMEEG